MDRQLIISVGREFGSGGHVIAEALDMQGLAVAQAALRLQKDVDGQPMNYKGDTLIVGPENEMAARRLATPHGRGGGRTHTRCLRSWRAIPGGHRRPQAVERRCAARRVRVSTGR